MKLNQKSVTNGVQNIIFPMQYMNITQGNDGRYSHQGVYALDLAGKDGGRDPFYAPFDVVCRAIDSATNGNAEFWESQKPVRFADGSIDYATIMVLHDNSTDGVYVGAKYAQGTQIAMEGTAGNATGNHNHFEIAKGKFSKMYNRNQYGVYHLPNSTNAANCCFADDTIIINGDGMAWKYTSKEKPQVETHKICYRVHVKDSGWLAPVYDGDTAGTTSQSKRVEALKIDPLGLDIRVKAHMEDIGWIDYGKITRDTLIGTTGESKRLEAICIKCDNLMYRVHIAGSGWSAWTMADGVTSLGTVGMKKAIEAIEMKII